MRFAIVLSFVALALSGCAATVQPTVVERDYVPSTTVVYAPSPAPALVFDPPGCAPVEIYREPRGYAVPEDPPVDHYYDDTVIIGGYLQYRYGWQRHDYFGEAPVRSIAPARRGPEPSLGTGGHGGTRGGTGGHGKK